MSDTKTPRANNETDLIRAQIERLEAIQNGPSVALRVESHGGGLQRNGQTFTFEKIVVLDREELSCVLNRLRTALATREELGW